MTRADVAVAPADAAAFSEFLAGLSEAVRLRRAGDGKGATLAQLGANCAAYRAFPVGSPESGALGLLLGSALRVTAELTAPALPAAYLRWPRRQGDDGHPYDDYVNDSNQAVSVRADGPDGERPAADTAAEAQRRLAGFSPRRSP